MTAAVVIGGQPPQLDEFEAQCLEVRDVAVQCGAIGHRTNQQGVGARVDGLERLQRIDQRGREPARDPKSVVISVHGGLPFRGIACALLVGASG
jgi:hypothetical protein